MLSYADAPLEVDPWSNAFFYTCFLPLIRLQPHPRLATPCWIWTGRLNDKGYGIFDLPHGQRLFVHRYALQVALWRDLGDMLALHHCDVRACCNPLHLYAGTTEDNIRDRAWRGVHAGLAQAWSPFVGAVNVVQKPSAWTRPL